jgi:hypothetical protein
MRENVFLSLVMLLAFSLNLVARAEEAKEVELEVRGMT